MEHKLTVKQQINHNLWENKENIQKRLQATKINTARLLKRRSNWKNFRRIQLLSSFETYKIFRKN